MRPVPLWSYQWENDEKITFEANKAEDGRRPGIVGDKGVYSEGPFVEEMLYAAMITRFDAHVGRSIQHLKKLGIMGKQQAVRMGKWKGVRFGGTKEPVELYDLSVDIGEMNNVAEDHPDIVERMNAIMKEARENSEYAKFWPLPESTQDQIKWDKWIFDQLENGIR